MKLLIDHAAPVGVVRQTLLLSLRVLLLASGAAFLAWVLVDTRFRAADGYLNGEFILPTSAGLALLLLGWLAVGRWRTAALWFSLALVGNAAALQLIDAGPLLGYQHTKPLGLIFTEVHPALLALLLAQTLVVAVGLVLRAKAAWMWLRSTFRWWQLAAIGLIFGVTSATVSPQLTTYLSELVLATFIQSVQLGTVVLMVWSVPWDQMPRVRDWTNKVLGPADTDHEPAPGRPDRFVLLAAAWVLVLTAFLALAVYESHPHIPDEVAYLYQARYLADGNLSMTAPAVPAAFEIFLMEIKGGEWYSAMLPGWPAVLSLGVLAGVPWLVNPLLAALNVVLAYLFVREIYSRRIARIVVLLLAVSPWFLFLGMSFMNHQLALSFALLAGLGVAWARRTGRWFWAWPAGAAIGLLVLVRPLEAVAIAAVLGLWAIGIGGKRLPVMGIAGLVLGAILVGSTVLAYNARFTGAPTEFPVMVYFDEHFHPNAHGLGFGPDRGMGWAIDPYPGHSPRDGVINANLNTFAINVELLGWGIGSLLLASVAVFSGSLRRSDYLMLGVLAAIFIPHFFNYFSGGPDFGARYWFLMIVPLLVLTARGLQFLESRFSDRRFHGAATLAVLALSVIALANFVPWRAVDKYHDFRNMQPDVRQLAQEHQFGKSLVLVRGQQHPDYTSAAIYNPIDLTADAPIYAWDNASGVREQLEESYPDRPVWVLEGPSITGGGFELVETPDGSSRPSVHLPQ